MGLFDRTVAALLPVVPRPLVARFSRPYLAGPSLETAFETVRGLNALGAMATLDLLGEHVTASEQAEAFRDVYIGILEGIPRAGLDANVSIKLTQMGLQLSPEICYGNIRAVVAKGAELGIFVRLDMEDSSCTTDTLAIHERLRREFDNVGVVLQAMLRRTLADAVALARARANVRVCKGIYREPARLAYEDAELIRRNYTLVLETLIEAGCYAAIATHDERLIWEGLRLANKHRLTRDRYEFQMLLGVREDLRAIVLEQGERLRVYVPFGEQSQAYALRRLRENPRIAGHVARALLRRRSGA